jgi:Spy/CpxP family protein refolding chaperone
MNLGAFSLILALSLIAASHAGTPAASPSPSPYAGEQTRPIKALSASEEEGLMAGKGMGLARAAELNGYPGPMHVLELAAELELTEQQRVRTEAVYKSMHERARKAGAELIEAERELDDLFASGTAEPNTLHVVLLRVAALQAQVREIHLAAHLEQKAILSPEQVSRYSDLRGYSETGGHGKGHPTVHEGHESHEGHKGHQGKH